MGYGWCAVSRHQHCLFLMKWGVCTCSANVSALFSPHSPVPDYIKSTVETAMKIHQMESDGDILAFLTGQVETWAFVLALQCCSVGFVKPPQPPAFLSCADCNLIKDANSSALMGAELDQSQRLVENTWPLFIENSDGWIIVFLI